MSPPPSPESISPLDTTMIAAAAAILGVLLGGLMARSRERWRWRADNKRDAYLELLRSLNEVDVAYREFTHPQPTDTRNHLAERVNAVKRAAALLEAARVRVRLVGSRRMRRYVDNQEIASFTMEVHFEDDPASLSHAWNARASDGVWLGWAYRMVDWLDEVEKIAVRELRPDRLRAVWDWATSPVEKLKAWRKRRKRGKELLENPPAGQ